MTKTGKPLLFLAAIGLGALIQYFMDSGRGDRRRHVLYDKARKALRLAGREAHDAAQNARNHVTGAAAELRSRIADSPVDDAQLVDRVRAELGHHVDRPRAVEVFAENGNVTLTGAMPEIEIRKAVATASSVPGVRSVDNKLVSEPLPPDTAA